jgi:hypothetical protein
MSRARIHQHRTLVVRSTPAHRRLLAGGLLALAAVGCGSPPSADEVLDTVRSWTATATLAAAERRDAAISERYTRDLAAKARAARQEAAQALAAAPSSPADRARAGRALDSLDLAVGRLAALAQLR